MIVVLNDSIGALRLHLEAAPNEVVAAGWCDRVYGEAWMQPDGVRSRVSVEQVLKVLRMKYPGRTVRVVLFQHPWTA